MAHNSVQNLINIKNQINLKTKANDTLKIIAVSKTFGAEAIKPLIEYGHIDFGENKVQETLDKWSDLKLKNKQIKLHMIGKLQTNKVKNAVKIFDYIHSVDSKKLAKKIVDEQSKINKKIKVFLQINIGAENQKSGINKNEVKYLFTYCKEINLDVIGLMCIPPINVDPEIYYNEMYQLNMTLGLEDLSMGMSSDFFKAIKYQSTYVRIGTSIFGERT